jgi:hypothetical protein
MQSRFAQTITLIFGINDKRTLIDVGLTIISGLNVKEILIELHFWEGIRSRR